MREVMAPLQAPIWFQLYVLKDRGFMRDTLQRAQALGITRLVFTVDLPVHSTRYREQRSGTNGAFASLRRLWQAMTHPSWPGTSA